MSVQDVKQFVARVFVELGGKTVFHIRETLFLENGECMAVAYRSDELSAVWCCVDGIIEFRRDGDLLRTVELVNEEAAASQAV